VSLAFLLGLVQDLQCLMFYVLAEANSYLQWLIPLLQDAMMPERNILNIWSELCRRYQRIFIHQFDSLNTAEI